MNIKDKIVETRHARLYVFEPGDCTRYKFLITLYMENEVIVAGAPDFKMETYSLQDILSCYNRIVDIEYPEEILQKDYMINIIQEISKCNIWTARAMVLIVKVFIDDLQHEANACESQEIK